MFLLANLGRPWGGKRIWNLFVVEIFVVEEDGGMLENFVACGGRKRKERKRKNEKKIKREDIFLDSKVKLLKKSRIPGIQLRMRKSFGKLPKSSRNQVSRNDSQKFTKIENIILRLMVKFVLRNNLLF